MWQSAHNRKNICTLRCHIYLRLAIIGCIYDNFILGHNMTLQQL